MTALGNAPAHWRRTTIGEIAEVRLGRQRSPKNHAGDQMQRYLRAANVTWYRLRLDDVGAMNFTNDEMKTYALMKGDILVVEGGTPEGVGQCALVTPQVEGLAFQNTLIRVRPHPGVDSRWLMYRLNADGELGGYRGIARGAGNIQHISSSRYKNHPVAIPPFDEQQAIVETIERMLSHLDAAAGYAASAVGRLPVARAALLRSITGGASVETWPLEDVAAILDSRRVPVNAAQRAKRPGAVPYYGAAGQVGTIDDALFDEPLVLLGEDGVKFDSLIARKAYAIDGPAWVNNHAHVLRPRPGVRQLWLEAALNAADYSGLYSGTTRLKLNQAQMKRLHLPVPPVDEQDRLLARLASSQTILDHAGAAAAGVVDRSAALRRSLLRAAFEGQLTSSVDAPFVEDLVEAIA